MMFKNSYFDGALLKDKLKKSAWILTLYSVTMFFGIPVANAIQAQQLQSRLLRMSFTGGEKEAYITESINSLLSLNNKLISFLVVCFAVIAALSAFYYVNSKKQTDFYHSLPLRREKLFSVSYLSGVLYFVLPYLGNTIISLALIAGSGFAGYLSFGSVAMSVLVNLLYYFAIYSICVFSCILCGNVIVAMLGCGVFLGYFPALIGVWLTHFDQYYETFYIGYYNIMRILRNASPVFDLFSLNGSADISALRVFAYLGLIAAIVALSVFLYKKRPSEAAGRAMAFRLSKPIIKYPLVFLFALCGGLFFYSAGGNDMGWMIFGYFSGIILTHMIVEVIYHFDIKGMFRQLKPLGFFTVLFAAMVLVMAFDVTGYDTKLPSSGSVKAVSLNIDRMNDIYSAMGLSRGYDYNDREKQILSSFTLSDENNIEAALSLASLGVDAVLNSDNRENYLNNVRTSRVGIVFELDGGREMRRQYTLIDAEKAEQYLMQIYDTDEYKDKLYGSLRTETFDATNLEIVNSYFRSTNSVVSVISAPEKVAALAKAAGEDLFELKSEQLRDMAPELLFEFSWREEDAGTGKAITKKTITIPVYGNAKRTVALLGEYGISIPSKIQASQVDSITVSVYDSKTYYASVNAQKWGEYTDYATAAIERGVELVFDDKADIASILPYLIPQESTRYNPFLETDDTCHVVIRSGSFMNGYNEDVVFAKDKMPSFVAQRISEKLAELAAESSGK